jgi:hypothetical protein
MLLKALYRIVASGSIIAVRGWDVHAPLCEGRPEEVGLLPEPLLELQRNASEYLAARNCERYPFASINSRLTDCAI